MSQAKFELCNLLYRWNEMPAGQINNLLNIITAMNAMSWGEVPFATHKDIYSTIDVTNLGDTPWDHFNLNYQGEKNANPSLWQSEDFTLWFCNPLTVLHNLLSNPDFNGVFNYSSFQECNKDSNHRYENLMLGNWCWKQAICYIH